MSAHKVPEYLAISFPEQVGIISTGSVPKYKMNPTLLQAVHQETWNWKDAKSKMNET